MEQQPLARAEPDAQRPLLPLDLVALHREARALGLGDFQGLEIGARLLVILACPVAGLGRQRHRTIVFQPDELLAVEVDDSDEILDGPGVAVITGLRADPAEGPHEPLALVFSGLVAVVSRRPGVDHDQAHVLDASLLHRLSKDRRLADRLFAFAEFVDHDRRLHSLGKHFITLDDRPWSGRPLPRNLVRSRCPARSRTPRGRRIRQTATGGRRPLTARSGRRSRTGHCRQAVCSFRTLATANSISAGSSGSSGCLDAELIEPAAALRNASEG